MTRSAVSSDQTGSTLYLERPLHLHSRAVEKLSVSRSAELFARVYSSRGYVHKEPKPLFTPDETLTYVNSTIAIFKDTMLASNDAGKQFVIQPCFRHRPSQYYGYLFKMLGAFADIAHLDDAFNAITECLEQVGLKKEQLHIVLNPEDRELVESSNHLFREESRIHFIQYNDGKYSVTWKFGQKELSGRGITFVYKTAENEEIGHSSYIPLGNVIIVTTSTGKKYIDVGFGIECILSSYCEGNIFRLPFYENQIKCIQAGLAIAPEKAKMMVKCLHPIVVFLKEGIAPSQKGSGYILKRLFRDFLEALDELAAADAARVRAALEYLLRSLYDIYAAEEGISQELWNRIFEEFSNQYNTFCMSLNQNVQKAQKILDKEKGTSSQRSETEYHLFFKETLGLTEFRIASLIKNRSFV